MADSLLQAQNTVTLEGATDASEIGLSPIPDAPTSPEAVLPTPETATVAPHDKSLEPWMLAPGIPGVGEKPEWVSSKFGSMLEQAKAYPEAQKKLGGFTGAPEAYDTEALEKVEGWQLDRSDPMLKNFESLAKESNMSQATFDKVVGSYIESQIQSQVTPQDELDKLGPNYEEKISNVSNWINNNFSEQEASSLKAMATSAENIMILDKMRNLTKESGLQSAREASKYQEKVNEKYLQQLVGSERYMKDSVFRDQVARKFEEHYNK